MQFKNYLPKKEFFTNKWTWITLGGSVFLILGMLSVYLYSPKFLPQSFISANKKIIEAAVGKELATVIDQKRDADGATSIRTLFNTNKEENLTKHCEKKEEKGQIQEKCYKTYRDDEYGYSFEYLEGWNYEEKTEELRNEGSLGKDTLSYSIIDPSFTTKEQARITIILRNSYGLEGDLQRIFSGTPIMKIDDILINNISSKIVRGSIQEADISREYVTIVVPFNQKVITFNMSKDLEDKEVLSEEFEDLYNSFQIK